jgi:predicted MFS family arabinose efflux permease
MVGVMVFIFAAVPFIDVIIVRYVDDRVRSRVAGIRLAVSLGISSLAVWLLGPAVKDLGFGALFLVLAGLALLTALVVALLPSESAVVRNASNSNAGA